MKKFLCLAVVVLVIYTLIQRSDQQKREKVVGVWSMEQNVQGGWGKLILNLKEDGNATVDVSATIQGHVGSREGFGTWKYRHSSFVIHLDRGDILPLLKHRDYGGKITNLDEHSLTYRGQDGVETWSRLR